jgi:type II secretory pathway pseudopilin PulG
MISKSWKAGRWRRMELMARALLKKNKGQAIVEMAILGSLILFVFGLLLSYMQRQNDQQYIAMETFRRAQEKACTYQGETSEGAGASVQLTEMQNRRNVDLSSGFKKGSPSNTGYSSNVFWAVPKVGSQPESLIAYRINEDEKVWNYRDFVPKNSTNTFRVEDTDVNTDTDFEETVRKQESPSAITNTKQSTLKDTITTEVTYTIRAEDTNDNPSDDEIVEPLTTLWEVEQRAYRDQNGQIKYSEEAKNQDLDVESGRTWTTGF